MKLLTRTSRSYIVFSGLAFIISGVVIYTLLHQIFNRQLDETLNEEKLLIEQTINYSDSVPDFRLVFGHMIDVTILNTPQKSVAYIHDTLMYDREPGTFASFRHLYTENTSVRNKGYIINIYKPLKETERLITEIIVTLAMVFTGLLLLLSLANYYITRRIWVPFYRILSNLSTYEIHQSSSLELVKTDIHEFKLLNQALEMMSRKIHLDYLNLKEFNENAAHELQTPLAVIKSKLELLVQKENMDEEQLQLVSAAFDSTKRMSKLIQGLLLISKIENNQFLTTEVVEVGELMNKVIAHFEEMIEFRGLVIIRHYHFPARIVMSPVLADILVTNLLSNAIRHNVPEGKIDIHINSDHFSISNTGENIKHETAEFFKRFRKSENHKDSIGLGLSIVQKIATLYHMKVEYRHSSGIHTIQITFTDHFTSKFPQNQ